MSSNGSDPSIELRESIVIWWNSECGHGHAAHPDHPETRPDVWLHWKNIVGREDGVKRDFTAGQRVRFLLRVEEQGPMAVCIEPLP